MPEAAKPAAVLRVKPSEELTTAPLFRYHTNTAYVDWNPFPVLNRRLLTPRENSLFHPIGPLDHQATLPGSGNVNDWRKRGVQYASAFPNMIYNQPYAAASKLDGKSIPSNYRQIDYQAWIGVYVGFLFLVPVCIAWYYVVMGVPDFRRSPRFSTWFVVRLPILVAAGSLGAAAYCAAQVCIIGAAFFHLHKNRNVYPVAMVAAFVANCVHMIFWGLHLTTHGHLSSFAPYAHEYMSEYGIVSRGATTLFLPIMRWFLLIEPVIWCFITLLRLAATIIKKPAIDFELYEDAMSGNASIGSMRSRYVLLATTTQAGKRNKI